MNYSELAKFIEKEMRISHIYQPVFLIALLENNDKCHQREIAKARLSEDQSQIEYYTTITNNMVGKVLRNHAIVTRDKATKEYSLANNHPFTNTERNHLIELCKSRLLDFVSNRRKSTGYISGTIRYEVLKRARFRCELCGISAGEKALEVDHILPRNHGGSDDIRG